MQIKELQNLFEQEQVRQLSWTGNCWNCNQEVEVVASVEDDGRLQVEGGAIYRFQDLGTFLKCTACYEADSVLRNYQPMEVYSRVVGYYRPVTHFNPGKQEEFRKRVNFKVDENWAQKEAS